MEKMFDFLIQEKKDEKTSDSYFSLDMEAVYQLSLRFEDFNEDKKDKAS